jgi:hypothetical protein
MDGVARPATCGRHHKLNHVLKLSKSVIKVAFSQSFFVPADTFYMADLHVLFT